MFVNDIHSLLKSEVQFIKCCWWNRWHSFGCACVRALALMYVSEQSMITVDCLLIFFVGVRVLLLFALVWIRWLLNKSQNWKLYADLNQHNISIRITVFCMRFCHTFGYFWCLNKTDNFKPNTHNTLYEYSSKDQMSIYFILS